MALRYGCVKCGWLESTHILGVTSVKEADRRYLETAWPGYRLAFNKCRKYKPSAVEQAEVRWLNQRALQVK